MSQGSSGIVVGRASGEAMHEGAVRVMAKGAGRRPLPVTRGTACGGKVIAPAGKTPKTKGRGRQVKRAHGVVLDREEVVRESVNKDAMQARDHGREQVKGTVETRADFSGEPPVEGRGRRARRDTHVAKERDGNRVKSRHAPSATMYFARRKMTGGRGEAWSRAHRRPKQRECTSEGKA